MLEPARLPTCLYAYRTCRFFFRGLLWRALARLREQPRAMQLTGEQFNRAAKCYNPKAEGQGGPQLLFSLLIGKGQPFNFELFVFFKVNLLQGRMSELRCLSFFLQTKKRLAFATPLQCNAKCEAGILRYLRCAPCEWFVWTSWSARPRRVCLSLR